MKILTYIFLTLIFGIGMLFAHIPQPKNPSDLSNDQMKEISSVVGELHKKGASHEELHKAVIKLYKQWEIDFKKPDIKKQKSQK